MNAPRHLFLLAALMVPAFPAEACTLTRILPDGSEHMSRAQIDRHFIKDDFDSARIVVLATVRGVRHTKGWSLYTISPTKVWKSDGTPIAEIFAQRHPTCEPEALEVGSTYIVFAWRAPHILNHVGATTVPLQLGLDSARSVTRNPELIKVLDEIHLAAKQAEATAAPSPVYVDLGSTR